jgi:hypothetical protein
MALHPPSSRRTRKRPQNPRHVIYILSSLFFLYAVIVLLDPSSFPAPSSTTTKQTSRETSLFSSGILTLGVPFTTFGAGLLGWTRTRGFAKFVGDGESLFPLTRRALCGALFLGFPWWIEKAWRLILCFLRSKKIDLPRRQNGRLKGRERALRKHRQKVDEVNPQSNRGVEVLGLTTAAKMVDVQGPWKLLGWLEAMAGKSGVELMPSVNAIVRKE